MCYVCMFSPVFPLAGLIAIVNNIIFVFLARLKLVYFKKRPIPLGAENMGIWSSIFFYITVFGSVVALAVMIITG